MTVLVGATCLTSATWRTADRAAGRHVVAEAIDHGTIARDVVASRAVLDVEGGIDVFVRVAAALRSASGRCDREGDEQQ
jgi:hypothetical protein